MLSRWFSWRFVLACLWFIAAGLLASAAHAKGTAAGTKIPNTATLNYVYGGKELAASATAPVITVAELIEVSLVSQDAGLVSIRPADVDKPLTFVMTNAGNGFEAFRVTRDNQVSGNQFNPLGNLIYFESGAQAGLQTSGANADIAYVLGVNEPVLKPDQSQIIYLPSSISGSTAQGGVGRVNLKVVSTTVLDAGAVNAPVGTTLSGKGDKGADAVLGLSVGQATSQAGYVVSNLSLTLTKTVVSVVAPDNKGSLLMPGSVVTYRIVLYMAGAGSVENFVFTDPLPTDLTYVAGSLSVDSNPQTDAEDSDASSVVSGVIKLSLGAVSAPFTHVVEFKTVVN